MTYYVKHEEFIEDVNIPIPVEYGESEDELFLKSTTQTFKNKKQMLRYVKNIENKNEKLANSDLLLDNQEE